MVISKEASSTLLLSMGLCHCDTDLEKQQIMEWIELFGCITLWHYFVPPKILRLQQLTKKVLDISMWVLFQDHHCNWPVMLLWCHTFFFFCNSCWCWSWSVLKHNTFCSGTVASAYEKPHLMHAIVSADYLSWNILLNY